MSLLWNHAEVKKNRNWTFSDMLIIYQFKYGISNNKFLLTRMKATLSDGKCTIEKKIRQLFQVQFRKISWFTKIPIYLLNE